MYTYAAGSPRTFGHYNTNYGHHCPNGYSGPRLIAMEGPGSGTDLQAGQPLSYAPRFGGLGATEPELYAQYRAAGMSHEQAQTSAKAAIAKQMEAAESAATGTMWASIIGSFLQVGTSIYSQTAQQKLIKQQQHQADRDRAAALELAKTQRMYIDSGSIVPAGGSTVMMTTTPRRGGNTMMLIGGVAVAGFVGWMLFGRKRRR